MRPLFVLILLTISCSLTAGNGTASELLTASGGQLTLVFYRGNLNDSGLSVEGVKRLDFQHDTVTLQLPRHESLQFRAKSGHFTRLEGGQLPLASGLTIKAKDLQLKSSQLRIQPEHLSRDTLLLTDTNGMDWFHLDYGHYERIGQSLHARFLDLRVGHDLAQQLDDPTLLGHIVGYAMLETHIESPLDAALNFGNICPVDEPNWPTQEGFDADMAMLKLQIVSQIARTGGQVAIAPSAYFENIGSADVPWFAQFADTRNVDPCCADQGDGVCAPYGNDQGGILVYALYRFVDNRLEQLGQSQAKHAFNSVNLDTAQGSLACRAGDRGGRVVPSGCEDLYQASTNANQWFLGPREEIIAHTVEWLRAGSIWDLTGPLGVPDDNCDYMPGNLLFDGQTPCEAPVSDLMDRRMSVPEAELSTPDARYFIEAWYLVRDDINIFNSFGRKEVTPTFTSVWTFPEANPFQQGPVIDDFHTLQDTDAASVSDRVDSGEGYVQVSTSVTNIGEGQWQYDIALMNFDFDRALDRFDIPFPDNFTLLSSAYFDGDTDDSNDWVATSPAGLLRFQAPENVSLKWGSLVSFRFLADQAPVEVEATLDAAQVGEPDSLTVRTFSAVELVFDDGFE